MFSFTTAIVAAAVAVGVLASPADEPAMLARRNTPNSSGTNNGFFYQFCMLIPALILNLQRHFANSTSRG